MLVAGLACMIGCVLTFAFVLTAIQPVISGGDAASWLATAILVMPGGTFLIALALQAHQYFRPSTIPTPYVLYLRTFLGFSDNAVTAALFTIVGGRNRIAVLTAPRSNAASWDPILIAFRGNPIVRLSASSPVFLKAAAHEWERSVQNLVERASLVVVDVSDMSTGVRAELKMISREGISNKVIWLSETSRSDRLPQIRSLVGSAHMPLDRVILYERSWTAALPNLLIGFCLSELFVFKWLLSDSSWRSVTTLRELGSVIGELTGLGLPGLLLFAILFARPAIDRDAQRKLGRLLGCS
jgi:hypothetical protein